MARSEKVDPPPRGEMSRMRTRRFSEEQMLRIVRDASEGAVAEVAKWHGIPAQTLYQWRRRFGAMNADAAHRLKVLEAENATLKRMLADRMLDIEALEGVHAKRS